VNYRFFYSKRLQVGFLSYPKAGSCSIADILTRCNELDDPDEITQADWNESGISEDRLLSAITTRWKDFTVYAVCREPIERWISSLVFLCQTEWDLFHSDISDLGHNIADKADTTWVHHFTRVLVTLNMDHAHFCNSHMSRMLWPFLIVSTQHKNFNMIPLADLDATVAQVHGLSSYTSVHRNTAEEGYSSGFDHSGDTTHALAIKKIFIDALTPRLKQNYDFDLQRHDDNLDEINRYLEIEKFVWRTMVTRPDAYTDKKNLVSKILTDCHKFFGGSQQTWNRDPYCQIMHEVKRKQDNFSETPKLVNTIEEWTRDLGF